MAGYSTPTYDVPTGLIAMKNDLLKNEKTVKLVYLPRKEHRQPFIILHGRGSSAKKLAAALLSSTTTKNETLQGSFPYAKIMFPNVLEEEPCI